VLEVSIRQSFMCDVWDRLFVTMKELKIGKGKDPESLDPRFSRSALAAYVFLMEHVTFPKRWKLLTTSLYFLILLGSKGPPF